MKPSDSARLAKPLHCRSIVRNRKPDSDQSAGGKCFPAPFEIGLFGSVRGYGGSRAGGTGSVENPRPDYPGGAVASDGRWSATADAGAVPAAAGVLADARPVAWSCSGESSTFSAKWQATSWPEAMTRSSGSIVTHSSGFPSFSRSQQRGGKRQPDGGAAGRWPPLNSCG